jgi:WD40 repeat protein
MAGLVPALEAEMSYLTPSSVPLYQLLAAKESANAKTIFVIDQFEELFTHSHDAAERADFIHALLELTKTNRVVITMRADFWGEIAIYTDLKQAMQAHQELIAPMNVDELHSAMEKQAAVVGLRFDPTLSESILAEVKGEPGAMPLLQHALWELWNRRHGLWIKAEEYQAFGGVKQAIASTAEEVYASCSDFERERVRDIFLRLTRLDESGEGRDTRRRVLIEELIPANTDSSVTIKLLNKLAGARLIVKTDKDVEVSHEALIRHWSRLTEWLNEDRDNLRLREGVSESAREWENSKRDESLLNHRGGRLEFALAMSKLPRYQLNPMEQAYLNSCMALRKKEQRERERRLRWTATASIAAAIIFLVLGSFGLVKSKEAVQQAKIADSAANAAQAGELAALANLAINNNLALAHLLSIESYSKLENIRSTSTLGNVLNTSPQLVSYLWGHSAKVNSIAFSPDGKILASGSSDKTIILWDVNSPNNPIKISTLKGHTASVNSIAFSPDGKILASGGADTLIILWDVSSPNAPRILTTIQGHSDSVNSVAFSPDGRTLASGSSDATINLWDVSSKNNPIKLTLLQGHTESVSSVAFNIDGTQLASSSFDDTIKIWDLKNIVSPNITEFEANSDGAFSVAFNPDGKYLSYGQYQSIGVLDVSNSSDISFLYDLEGHSDEITSLAYNSDGKILASSSFENQINVWDLSDPNNPILTNTLTGHSDWVYALAFKPYSSILASGGADNSIILWDIQRNKSAMMQASLTFNDGFFELNSSYSTLTQQAKDGLSIWNIKNPLKPSMASEFQGYGYAEAFGITLSDDNKMLVAQKPHTEVDLWSLNELKNPVKQSTLSGSIGGGSVFSPNGDILTLQDTPGSSSIAIWDITNPLKPTQISQLSENTDSINDASFSPDGKKFASSSNNEIILWDISNPSEPIKLTTIKGHRGFITGFAFSPDSKTLVSIGRDNIINIWNIDSPANPTQMAVLTGVNGLSELAFSPDGQKLSSQFDNESIIIWDISDPVRPTQLAVLDNAGFVMGFDKNSQTFISRNDHVIMFWDLDPQVWIQRLCQRVGRNFTRAEWELYFSGQEYRATCPQWPLDKIITPTATP